MLMERVQKGDVTGQDRGLPGWGAYLQTRVERQMFLAHAHAHTHAEARSLKA